MVSYKTVEGLAEFMEKKYGFLSQAERRGIKATYDHNFGAGGNSRWAWGKNSTHITIERRASGWFLVDVERKQSAYVSDGLLVDLPEETKEAIIKRYTVLDVYEAWRGIR